MDFHWIAIQLGWLVADLLVLRWADGQLRGRRRSTVSRGLLGIFFAAQALYVAMWMESPDTWRTAHAWLPAWFITLTYVWHLNVVPLAFAAIMAFEIARLFRRRRHPVPTAPPAPEQTDTSGISRRELFRAAALYAPPLVTLALAARGYEELYQFRVRRITLPLPMLPPSLDGLTIAHLADAHVGRLTRPGVLRRIAETTNNLRADLVAFAGDLLDLSQEALPDAIDFVHRIDPRQGMAMCVGNHDAMDRENGAEALRDFRNACHEAALPMLFDSTKMVRLPGRAPVQLIGVAYGELENPRIHDLANPAWRCRMMWHREAFPIVLAHHPHVFDACDQIGFPLTLSGHTHGGQINIPGTGYGFGRLAFKYWSGAYTSASGRAVVVSNGVGTWFPLRIGAPAEIIHLTLRRA